MEKKNGNENTRTAGRALFRVVQRSDESYDWVGYMLVLKFKYLKYVPIYIYFMI